MTAAKTQSGWIISPLCDTLFFLAPPLLALAPVLMIDLTRFDSTHLLLLLAIVATGHHVPGFIRAYSDPELMAAYRGRMLLAPVLLIAAALWIEFRQVPGLELVLIVWGVWHFLMQNYGLMRIYGVKKNEFSPTTAMLDWLMMLTWISAVYLNNPHWSYQLQRQVYELGVPFAPAFVFPGLGWLAIAAACAVSVFYCAFAVVRWRRGEPASPLKYVLLLSTLLFFTAAFQFTRSILLVTVIVELVHDLQYYALAWAFQRRLSKRHSSEHSLLRLLFRPTPLMLMIYAGICFVYGAAIGDYGRTYLFEGGALAQVTTALLAAATLFHFYSDGFIWKIRQPQTREYLGIDSSSKQGRRAAHQPAAWRRSLVHLTIYAVILILFASARSDGRDRSLEISAALADRLPRLGDAHHTLGYELQLQGRTEEALREYELALQLGVDHPVELRQRMASSWEATGQFERASQILQQALQLAPADKTQQVAGQLALLFADCPNRNFRNGAAAVRLAESAVPVRGPKRALYLDILAASYREAGRYHEASQAAQLGLQEARRHQNIEMAQRLTSRLVTLRHLAAEHEMGVIAERNPAD